MVLAMRTTDHQGRGDLLRILGVGFGIAVTVGGTVGVGILRTPGLVAEQIPNVWAIVVIWILGGFYALLGTISVVELGTMLPSAGGWYVYARRAFGNYGGFTVGWIDWIAQSAALAFLSTAIGEFTVALFPGIPGGIRFVAISTLVFFAVLHWMGLRSSSWTQDATSLLKGIALLGFVGVCFLYGRSDPVPPLEAGPLISTGLLAMTVAVVVALQSVIVTYDGWYSAIYFTEEDRDPGRNLPRSAIGGVLCIMGIYVLVNFALLYTLPLSELAGSILPAADAAQKIFGGEGGRIITALSLLSLLSVINAVLLLATRILFAMSRDGLFFSRAADVNPRGTPIAAMLLTTGSGIALVATGTFETLIAIASFFYVAVYISGFLALFVLRKREPDLPRPFRVWGYPWPTLIALVGSVAFLVASVFGDTRNSAYALLLIAASYPIFLAVTHKRRRP
jgi:APA family basic amino acid/polyamine antiporter